MKRNFRLFSMVCLAGTLAFFASSCKKSEEKQAVQVILPEFEEVVVDDDNEGKAYIDFQQGGKFYWNGLDEIMVYNVDNRNGENTEKSLCATDATAEGQTLTQFFYVSGDEFTPRKNHYFVFYPVSRITTGTDHLNIDNREYFDVPEVQNYTLDPTNTYAIPDPNAMALAVEVDRLNAPFTMKHIFGVVRVNLKGNAAVDRIVITDKTVHLTGTVSMKIHEVNMNTFSSLMNMYNYDNLTDHNSTYYQQWYAYNQSLGYEAQSDDMGMSVTLDCTTVNPEGVQLDPDNKTAFYFMMRPGALLGGFYIDVYKHGSTTPVHITKYENPDDRYCTKPGTIVIFGPGDAWKINN